METSELLLSSSLDTHLSSVLLWDYKSSNILKYYKSGGSIIAPKTLNLLGSDYIIGAELNKPILQTWLLNSQETSKTTKLILPSAPTCVTICPNNCYLAVGIDATLYIWQIASGKLLCVQQKHYRNITVIKFSSDGDIISVGGEDGLLIVYKLSDLISVHNNLISYNDGGLTEPMYTKTDHGMPITDIYMNNFGRKSRIASVSLDQTCRLYVLLTGELLLNLVFEEQLTALRFDTLCWNLFVGSKTGNIFKIYLRNPGRTVEEHVSKKNDNQLTGHKQKITSLELNITNTILASGSEDGFIFIWEIKSQQILKKLEHKGIITNLKFVMNHENYFKQTLKPVLVFKPLERNVDYDSDQFICIMQSDDIASFDDEVCQEKEKSIRVLENQNNSLRIINKQLYETALLLTKQIK